MPRVPDPGRADDGNDGGWGARHRPELLAAVPPGINPVTNTVPMVVLTDPVVGPVLLYNAYSGVVLGVGNGTVPIPVP